jgi:hypothetical protein
MVHNLLPTRKHKSRFQEHVNTLCHYCREDESFDHLLRCNNPVSEKFRTAMIRSIRAYCFKSHLPPAFTTVFAGGVKDWLFLRDPLRDRPIPISAHPCIRHQTAIGWNLLLRGFVTTSWTSFLRATSQQQPIPNADNPSQIFAGLIKSMWTPMSEFWQNHLAHIHRPSPDHHGSSSLDRTTEYKAKIRLLHTKQRLCLAAHRDHYFYDDVEAYLQLATGNQMRSYILHYEKSIYDSIQAQTRAQTTTLLQFPGFQRQPPPPAPPPDNEEPLPHKHTRWRQTLLYAAYTVRNFISPNPTQP